MEEDCGSWLPQQQFGWQLPNLTCSSAPVGLGLQNSIPTIMNHGTSIVLTKGKLPSNTYLGLPHSQVVQANEPCAWFYCLPRFRQAFTPASNSVLKEQLPACPNDNEEAIKPQAGSAHKRFLVFDQSGDQTTMIFSPGIGTPIQCLASWGPRQLNANNLSGDEPSGRGEAKHHTGPYSFNELDETNGTDMHSEMHEDTEELDALLYSDEESDYTDDDEVTSTGHSPSTMTTHEKQDWFEGSSEEVASSARPTKKRKVFDGDYDNVPSPMVTANSMKFSPHVETLDDAEFSCGNSQNAGAGEMGSLSGNKRIRKDKIRETVSILRSILPDGTGKDAMVVLSEAIDYLKSLKLKAKTFALDNL